MLLVSWGCCWIHGKSTSDGWCYAEFPGIEALHHEQSNIGADYHESDNMAERA
jgi:hypothetical protein